MVTFLLQRQVWVTSRISNPKYDTVEDLYGWFFTELDACEQQLGTGTDHISGDVTSMGGDVAKWKKYANSLRMRYAMRISDVNPSKGQEEFEKAMNHADGYIASAADDAYIKYADSPYTYYDGANDYDFRTNALGEILYGRSIVANFRQLDIVLSVAEYRRPSSLSHLPSLLQYQA